ncbi:MAG TPA: hypothetical protein VFP96_13380, partial [Candidatus Acidoferrum sp.]|nr:hypothetical protein [Candidatus Acidoferrum sp.]
MSIITRLSKLAVPCVLAVCAALPATAARRVATIPPPTMDTSGQPPIVINISPGRSSARIVVPVDKSRIVHFDRAFSRVHVGS